MMKRNKLYIILCLYVIISVLTIGCSKKDTSKHINDEQMENNDDHDTENNNHTPNEEKRETNDTAHDVNNDEVDTKSESGKLLYYEVNVHIIIRAYNTYN